jgi:hypothetical protein
VRARNAEFMFSFVVTHYLNFLVLKGVRKVRD